MTSENRSAPLTVVFPDYSKSIPEWEKSMRDGIEEAVRIWETARASGLTDYENTFGALERLRYQMMEPFNAFSILADGGHSEARDLHEKIAPVLAEANARIVSDPVFAKMCKTHFDEHADQMLPHLRRHAEQSLLDMRLSGALLESDDDRKRLLDIAGQLASLEAKFQGMCSEIGNTRLYYNEDRLPGVDLSQFTKEEDGRYSLRLIREPVDNILSTCHDRKTREEVFRAFEGRGSSKDQAGINTNNVIENIITLRQEKAKLLGFENFSELKLAGTMAGTPEKAMNLIKHTWDSINYSVNGILDILSEMAHDDGIELEPWDTFYYFQKTLDRKSTQSLNKEEVRPTIAEARNAMFHLANSLFGLDFTKTETHTPFEGMDAWLVWRDGEQVGGFLTDFSAREGKPNGAWMHPLVEGHKMGEGRLPVVANTCNFGGGDDTRLSATELRTMFHEFGHALHGLLGRTHLASQAATNTLHDWVELPSQLFENWVSNPHYCVGLGLHREAGGGEDMFNDQLQKYRYLQSAMIDMSVHLSGLGDLDPETFGVSVLSENGSDKRLSPWHNINHFSHLFSSDQYASGYYAYLWAEVLDADVFRAITPMGVFNRNTGRLLEKYIYGAGDEVAPEELFRSVVGRDPTPDAMIARLGIPKPTFTPPKSQFKS